MAVPPGDRTIRVILLDIEGTTTPVDFVYRTLFPYARREFGQFLRQHASEPGVQNDIEALRVQHSTDEAEHRAPPEWSAALPVVESAVAYGL